MTTLFMVESWLNTRSRHGRIVLAEFVRAGRLEHADDALIARTQWLGETIAAAAETP